ncbi:MAG TPA: rhodanese family protein [Rhizomicrobium sp.]|jgi:rhodanese-related sulfurtransferase|nr:rhodanese family protein [Rhizomicrobium sp.]
MAIQTIDARAAQQLMEKSGAVLVDIREPIEHARESIPGAQLLPLSRFENGCMERTSPPVIFHCQGGNRTAANEGKLAACGAADVYLLKGGIGGWKEAGFATSLDRSKPIEIQRQVQIAAGSLILAGLVLALIASPWFAALSAFVGAGLVFAGASGWCGMAKVLQQMPWNKVQA